MPLVGWRECRNAWRDKEGGQEGDVLRDWKWT
jgi:hypothetical protein